MRKKKESMATKTYKWTISKKISAYVFAYTGIITTVLLLVAILWSDSTGVTVDHAIKFFSVGTITAGAVLGAKQISNGMPGHGSEYEDDYNEFY